MFGFHQKRMKAFFIFCENKFPQENMTQFKKYLFYTSLFMIKSNTWKNVNLHRLVLDSFQR